MKNRFCSFLYAALACAALSPFSPAHAQTAPDDTGAQNRPAQSDAAAKSDTAAKALSVKRVVIRQEIVSFDAIPGYQLLTIKDLPLQIQRKVVFAYVGPISSDFAANINLVSEPALPGLKTDAASVESLNAAIKQGLPLYKSLSSGTLVVDGEKAVFASGTFAMSGRTVQNKQVMVRRGDTIYTFTFSADPTVFTKQVVDFDTMMGTIKWP